MSTYNAAIKSSRAHNSANWIIRSLKLQVQGKRPGAILLLLTGILGFIGGASMYAFTLLARYGWFFDTVTTLRVHILLLLIVAGAAALFGKHIKLFSLTLLVLLPNLMAMLPFVAPASDVVTSGPEIRLLSANVFLYNNDSAGMLRQFQDAEADIILLVETSANLYESLSDNPAYPYSYYEQNQWDEGIIVLSRWPFTMRTEAKLDSVLRDYILADVATPAGPLTLFGIHTFSPSGPRSWAYRNTELAAISDFAASEEGNLIVAGDLNVSIWSPFLQDMVSLGNLQNGRQNQGILPTWPTIAGRLGVSIDHILASDGVAIKELQSLEPAGSDHRPLLATITLSG